MQIHPGSYRNHNAGICSAGLGRTRAPIFRAATGYVEELKPLLDAFGNDPRLTLILFTLDETSLQPRAGALGRPLSGLAPRAQPGGSMTVRRECAASVN